MPAENDLSAHAGILVYRSCEISGKFLALRGCQALIFHISDISVGRCDLGPFLHRIENGHRIVLCEVCEDLTLYAAFYSQTSSLFHPRYISCSPVIDQDTSSIPGVKGLDLHIRIVCDQTQRQIDLIIFYKKQRSAVGPLCLRVRIDDLVRERVYEKVFRAVPVEPLINVVIHPGDRQIRLSIFIDSCLLLPLIVIEDRGLIPGHIIDFREIRPLFRRHIPVQYLETDKSHGDQDDQTDSNQYRNYFSHSLSLFPHAGSQNSAFISVSHRRHAESLFITDDPARYTQIVYFAGSSR